MHSSDDALAQAIAVRRFGPKVQVTHMTQSTGPVYNLWLPDRRHILKLAESTDDRSILKEARVIALLQRHRVPSPIVEFCGMDDASAGRPFLLMISAGDQTVMDCLAADPHHALMLAAEMGTILAAIHGIDLPASGDIQVDHIVPHNPQAQVQRLHHLADWAVGQRLLRAEDAAMFNRLPMPNIDGTALCHMDFNAVHCVLSDGHIAAVVDWESAWAANPGIDLAVAHAYLEYHCPEALVRRFLDAYAAARPLPPEYAAAYLPVRLAHLLGLMWVWHAQRLPENVHRAAQIFTTLSASRR
jgi:aminoglycoside phosphotransferase (APT) family kinase protein